MTAQATAKYLKDYQVPLFSIPTTELHFHLDDNNTLVKSSLQVERQGSHQQALELYSEVKQVLSVKINGEETEFNDSQSGLLIIETALDNFKLEIECVVDPANNTSLEGLYKSSGVFCTQCEAESFRKITPFMDRPDVLSVFTVTVQADKDLYPSLLSNGNAIAQGEDAESNSHWVKWHDPFPKPCYLFALVAGDFDCLTDSYTTQSGREVELELFVDKGNLHLSHHAMESLKKSMAWDEETYGLEYDLDKYMVVAVDFFNMGAMENKGLNIFNSKFVLADEATATDTDYYNIESIIGHEYFHNWTGNRVTCRDWFQLSLKEGLTVFRDQQFSSDMASEVIERIQHANTIRTAQFDEDAGPMAHPIRPEKVVEMNNFYTVTVYNKGAEVIRMMHSLLGKQEFRAGMDLYFERHDGQAVTCDDFVAAMADANNFDLEQFKHWYRQAGTPVVKVTEESIDNKYRVTLAQSIPTRPESEQVHTLVIPVKYELLAKDSGASLERGTVIFNQAEQTFEFDCAEPAELVLFENFSAPVKVERQLSLEQRLHIVKFAKDPFSRWDQLQSLWFLAGTQGEEAIQAAVEAIGQLLTDENMDIAVKAELLAVPNFGTLAEQYKTVNVEQIVESKQKVINAVLAKYSDQLLAILARFRTVENGYQQELVAARRIKQVAFDYLSHSEDEQVFNLISDNYFNASNMTEKLTALNAAGTHSSALFKTLLTELDTDHKDSVLVFDKLSTAVARQTNDDIFQQMEDWSQHTLFNMKNPNRVRALYGAFTMANPEQFHHASGRGYEFLTDLLIKLDKFNPQLAARMMVPLLSFKRFDAERQEKMLACLSKLKSESLSKDMFEKVNSVFN